MSGSSEGARKGWTPERRARQSEANRRRAQDPEISKKISDGVKAAKQRITAEQRSDAARKSHTPASDQKRSESMRRTWDDQDYRDRRAATEAQPTTKARRSAAAHEVNNRPGRREQQSEIMREKFAHDDDFRRRHTAGLKAAMQADEYYGEKRAEAMKQAWRELRGDLRNSFKLLEERPLTAYESAVALVLLRDNIAFVPHDTSSGYEMDLYVPSKNLDIEVDGKHHLRDKFIAKDTERDQVLTNRGYAILRISHDEIDDKSFISMIIDALTP